MKLMSYTFFPHVPYTANDSIRTPTIAKKKKFTESLLGLEMMACQLSKWHLGIN